MDANQIIRDDSPVSIFNPLPHDFTDELRGDDNSLQVYKIPSMEIVTYPAYIASRLKKDLITQIVNERSIKLPNEKMLEDITKEVEVNLNG